MDSTNLQVPVSANPDPKPKPKPIPKPNTGLGVEEMSHGAFFKMIGLASSGKRNVLSAKLAIDRANELNILGWNYDSANSRFYRLE